MCFTGDPDSTGRWGYQLGFHCRGIQSIVTTFSKVSRWFDRNTRFLQGLPGWPMAERSTGGSKSYCSCKCNQDVNHLLKLHDLAFLWPDSTRLVRCGRSSHGQKPSPEFCGILPILGLWTVPILFSARKYPQCGVVHAPATWLADKPNFIKVFFDEWDVVSTFMAYKQYWSTFCH